MPRSHVSHILEQLGQDGDAAMLSRRSRRCTWKVARPSAMMSCHWTWASPHLPRVCPAPWSMPLLSSPFTSECFLIMATPRSVCLKILRPDIRWLTGFPKVPRFYGVLCLIECKYLSSRVGGCSFVERFERLLERVHGEERDVIVSFPRQASLLHVTFYFDEQQTWQVARMGPTPAFHMLHCQASCLRPSSQGKMERRLCI